MKKIFLFLLLLLAACAPLQEQPVACTEEAKMCPDGTAVVRVGPDCAFEPCPEPVFCTADAKECPDGSYVGRVAPDCAFAPCPEPSIAVEPAPETTQPNIVAELLKKAYAIGHAYEVKDGIMYVHQNKARLAYTNLLPVAGLKHEGRAVYFTDVYFDRHKKTATGVCNTEREIRIATNYEAAKAKCTVFKNMTWELLFADYYSQTPLDWLERYQNEHPTTVVEAEQAMKIQTGYKTVQPVIIYERDEDRTTIHIDKNNKLPLRVEVIKDDIKTLYDYTKIFFEVQKPQSPLKKKIGEAEVTPPK